MRLSTIVLFVCTLTIANLTAKSTCSKQAQPGECKGTRIIRAVGIVPGPEHTEPIFYFYRANPLYPYALAAAAQKSPVADALWDRLEGCCALVNDWSRPWSSTIWKKAVKCCRAEKERAKNGAITPQFNAKSVMTICYAPTPLQLAFEADSHYIQSRLACFQRVTAACANPDSDECKKAMAACEEKERDVADVCFAGKSKKLADQLKGFLKGPCPGATQELRERQACYAYCSSLLEPVNLRDLIKIKGVTPDPQHTKYPHLQISNDGGYSFSELIGI